MSTKYTHRQLARIVIEAATPMSIGTGRGDVFSDALVARDVNGFPYIPGTSIAGVVRSMIGKEESNDLFGYQEGKDGKGSEVIFTEARILDSNGNVIDNMIVPDSVNDPVLKMCHELPVRQHVKIGSDGTGVKGGKFDEQVIYTGTRFCFEIEMVGAGADTAAFDRILEKIQNRNFRVGGGTRTGFGEIKVVSVEKALLDLTVPRDLELYLAKSSDLSGSWEGWKEAEVKEIIPDEYDEYTLELQPRDFFLFSSGFGDSDADITPVKERRIVWKDGAAAVSAQMAIIPATSLKGAISHRVAYHWNKRNGLYAGNPEAKTGEDNPAVQQLFGYQNESVQKRGNVFFSDLYVEDSGASREKVQHHVMVDRFTGGAIQGALFQEKLVFGADSVFRTSIFLSKTVGQEYVDAFEDAVSDIANGILPLGGAVNRGHGMFTGKIFKNGVPLK